jgi:uncharacterized protein YndB with AHSA1/START domain
LPAPQDETSVVEREIRIEADPETVFPFFTDPEKMVRWMGIAATLDPRPGGVFSINTYGEYFMKGEFVTVEPNSRIVFTWGYASFPESENPMPAGSTTVEVELVADGAATIVRVKHTVPTALDDFHAIGWEHYLGRLGVAARGGDPGPDELQEVMVSLFEDDG